MATIDLHDEELELDDYRDEEEQVIVKTHEKINSELSGEIIKLEQGYVETRLITTPEMLADDIGLIHGGFIFSAADYAAMLAVNESNVVLVGSECQLKVRHKDGRKRNVNVEGFVLDIKVFEGEFKTVITDRHVLKLKLLDDKDKGGTDEGSEV
jgi:acyl-CoA thioesterase